MNFISYIKGVKRNIRNHQTFMGAHLMHRAKIKYPPVPLPMPAAEMESSNEGNEIIERIPHACKQNEILTKFCLAFPKALVLSEENEKFL